MNRTRFWAVLVLLGTFAAGVGVGYAIPKPRPRHRAPTVRFFSAVVDQLGLDETQQAAVNAALDRADARAWAILEKNRPALDAARAQTRADVLSVLSDTQKAAYLKLEATWAAQRRHRRRHRHPGPPPGPPR